LSKVPTPFVLTRMQSKAMSMSKPPFPFGEDVGIFRADRAVVPDGPESKSE
jgi:hypothetical protein